jgi:predicted metal-dependent hydrolase
MNYTVIHSNRKTLALQIKNGELIVRAPKRTSLAIIERFVSEHERWIQKHLAKAERMQAEADATPSLSEEELRALTNEARRVFSERVASYAPIIGVSYEKITIRHQSTRWGSCTARGNLNFNCLLLLAPPEVLDAIVVHELCHRKEMNHSPRFYAEVYRVCPNYDAAHKWLKEHGQALMSRLPK